MRVVALVALAGLVALVVSLLTGSTLLAILVVAVMVIPWLSRYLPWRASRLATVRAAQRAIRRAPT